MRGCLANQADLDTEWNLFIGEKSLLAPFHSCLFSLLTPSEVGELMLQSPALLFQGSLE